MPKRKTLGGVKAPAGITKKYTKTVTDYVSRLVTGDDSTGLVADVRNVSTLIQQYVKRTIKKNAADKGVALPELTDPWELRELWINTNVELITNAANDVKAKIAEAVKSQTITTEVVQAITGYKESRAKLIARDQVSKLNGQIAAAKHVQAGLTQYVWTTVTDERVRDEHTHLHGNVYKYGERTDEQDGLAPSEPIQCRCYAEPIIE